MKQGQGASAEHEGSGAVFSGRHDRRKVTDWVYEEVREAIIDLRLQPGEPLREATIAEQLGVSKTPVREALTRLEQEGLVETTSFKGAVVSGYSAEDLQEIYELRELLEGAAARAAAESAPPAERSSASCRSSAQPQLRDAGRCSPRSRELLGEFDEIVYDQVTNRRIRALIENLQGAPRADRPADRGHPGAGGGLRRGARADRGGDRRARSRRGRAPDADPYPERAERPAGEAVLPADPVADGRPA